MYLTEKHLIRKNSPYYKEIDDMCFLSKNLYNSANYLIRQEYINNKVYLNYYKTRVLLIKSKDYCALPRKVSNQILMYLDRAWKIYFSCLKSYLKSPNKFKGRPNIPKFKDSFKGRYSIIFEKMSILKNNRLSGLSYCLNTKKENINQVRIIPGNMQYTVEVLYKKEPVLKIDNVNYASIDLGVNNLATCVFNTGTKPFIINGRPLKSINQFYNKKKAKLQIKLKKNKLSNNIILLTNKRNNKVKDYLHQSSSLIINQLVSNNVSRLIIGNNKNWKQDINLGKKNNQNFTNIPHSAFISILSYKCLLQGINVKTNEESYTSKCSFLDNEDIKKHKEYKGKRIKRGLFKSSKGILINADVNGAYNILKKGIPNAFVNGIEGLPTNPSVLTVKHNRKLTH